MNKALALILCCSSLVTPGKAKQKKLEPNKGVIYGTVVSQNGQPGKRLWLMAEPMHGGQWPGTSSNDRGEYRFQGLAWGKYRVYVVDDDSGYRGDLVKEGDEPSEVEISPEHRQAEYRVVLPSKAGFLQIHLTNRKTGAAIPWMNVSVAPTEDPQHPFDSSRDSSLVILVPPDENLLLHVTAEGFGEWDQSAGTGKLIFVPSGTQLTLAVELEPAK
jgi:hypothetical protein